MTGLWAAVFSGPRRPIAIEPLILDAPRAGEVAVRMLASGVCHSDLHVIDGEWERPSDIVLGHEGAARVESLGPGVADRFPELRPGVLVVLAWTAPCGRCAACAAGQGWHCPQPPGAGHRLDPDQVRLHRADGRPVGAYSGLGTFGERAVVAAEAAIAVDPRTPPEVAALIGCAVPTGVGAVLDTARVRAGESVAIIGLGGVGLSAVMGAVLSGAHPIASLDRRPEKLARAVELGASDALRVDAVIGRDFDHVFECVGRSATVELALALTRPGGTTTLVGMTRQGERASFDVYRFVEDGRRLLGSNYGSAVPRLAFPRLATLHLAGRLPIERLISARIGLDGLEPAFERLRRGDGVRSVIVY